MGIIGEHVFEHEKKAALSAPVFSSCRRPSQIPGPRIWLRSGHNRVGGGSAVAHPLRGRTLSSSQDRPVLALNAPPSYAVLTTFFT
jgi:hypothetical protein